MMKLIIYCATICLLVSCYRNGEKCEEFNFKRLPFDRFYYDKQLVYTNGFDTITLYPDGSPSKESRLNPMSNPECNPYYEVSYEAKTGREVRFLYSFDYYPESDSTSLDISVNLSNILINVDSLMKSRIEQDEQWIFDGDLDQPDRLDSMNLIKKLVFQSMRITEIEKRSGEKWWLIKAGNKTWKGGTPSK